MGEVADDGVGDTALRRSVARWWGQQDRYAWFTHYLHARGLTRATRRLMAAVSAPLVLMVIGAIWPPAVDRGLNIAVSCLASLAGIGFAVMWLRRWPTRPTCTSSSS